MIEPSMRNEPCTPPNGKAVLSELRRCNVRNIVTVPDWVQIPLHFAAGEFWKRRADDQLLHGG